jgi:hypothetical protein
MNKEIVVETKYIIKNNNKNEIIVIIKSSSSIITRKKFVNNIKTKRFYMDEATF